MPQYLDTKTVLIYRPHPVGRQQKQQYPQLTNGYTIIANKVATVAIVGNNSSNNSNRRNYVCNRLDNSTSLLEAARSADAKTIEMLHGKKLRYNAPDSVGEVGAQILQGEPRLPQVDVDPVLEGVRLDLDPVLLPAPAPPEGAWSLAWLAWSFRSFAKLLIVSGIFAPRSPHFHPLETHNSHTFITSHSFLSLNSLTRFPSFPVNPRPEFPSFGFPPTIPTFLNFAPTSSPP